MTMFNGFARLLYFVVGLDSALLLATSTDQFNGCNHSLSQSPVGLRRHWLRVEGHVRQFVLYNPQRETVTDGLPLWIVVPGTTESASDIIAVTGIHKFAAHHQLAFAAVQGVNNDMNVIEHAQQSRYRPDDIAYIDAVVAEVRKLICVDAARIFCAGWSRGGRFCARLLSERAEMIAAMGTVSGIRFPLPNHIARPVPIIAFHGAKDPINPYWGHGKDYWHQSVPSAIGAWAHFNGCNETRTKKLGLMVVMQEHINCKEGADVILIKVLNGGHPWPGSTFYEPPSIFGKTSHAIDATEVMHAFFLDHPNLRLVADTSEQRDQSDLENRTFVPRDTTLEEAQRRSRLEQIVEPAHTATGRFSAPAKPAGSGSGSEVEPEQLTHHESQEATAASHPQAAIISAVVLVMVVAGLYYWRQAVAQYLGLERLAEVRQMVAKQCGDTNDEDSLLEATVPVSTILAENPNY